MSKKLIKKDNKLLARIVTEDPKPCAFCHRKVDDEINYGELYAIGDIQCHYFCALLSCCLVQRGPVDTGLFGFQYKDILTELERCKKHRCSFCGQGGANLGCSVTSCRKQFHLPCGREKHAVSLFYGTYKSFCQMHAPKQKLPDHIMVNAKRRKHGIKALKIENCAKNDKELPEGTSEGMVCVICYEAVEGFPTVQTFWPPCCARDAWFHRSCLQRMALSAGMHYLKCPLCNDKEMFYDAVLSQGYYIPDRDAAWELEQNAFSEIYERSVTCGADECHCPMGRNHDAENGPWDIKQCLLCGSVGRHLRCLERGPRASETAARDTFVCPTCEPVAPPDLDALAQNIEAVIQEEQAQAASARRRRPIMPSRMSLRRTKSKNAILNRPSSSRMESPISETSESSNTTSSRLDLNLKPPRKAPTPTKRTNSLLITFSPSKIKTEQNGFTNDPFSPPKDLNRLRKDPFSPRKDQFSPSKDQNRVTKPFSPSKYQDRFLKETFSPSKIIQGLEEKLLTGLNEEVIEKLRIKIMKPRPMCVKKKIVNETLQNLLNTSPKLKDPVIEWCSPKKHEFDITKNLENESLNIENTSTPKKIPTPDKENVIQIGPADDDDSNSTFQLPPEFVADCQSDDDSFNFETPKRKTVEIKQDSSLEIFEKDPDHSICIDVIRIENSPKSPKSPPKSPLKSLKSPLKNLRTDKIFEFSPLGKELVDVEYFMKEYLNEVGFNKVAESSKSPPKIRTEVEFAVKLSNNCQNSVNLSKNNGKETSKCKDVKKSLKRLMSDVPKEKNGAKKRKLSESNVDLHSRMTPANKNNKKDYKDVKKPSKRRISDDPKEKFAAKKRIFPENNVDINSTLTPTKNIKNEITTKNKSKQRKKSKKSKKSNKKLRITFDSDTKSKKNKLKTKLSVDNKNIKLKIKWKKERFHFKLESKSEKPKKYRQKSQKSPSKLKQYVLQYPTEGNSNDILVKPEKDVNPLKRKYVKQEKSPDNFKQTSLHHFFKVKSPNEK